MKKRKAWSMIELLIAMATISILVSIGLIYMKDYLENSKITALKSDMNSAVMKANKEYSKNFSYSSINEGDYKDSDNNGKSDDIFGNSYLNISSKEITINFKIKNCSTGNEGFILTGKSNDISSISNISFDSCLNGSTLILN